VGGFSKKDFMAMPEIVTSNFVHWLFLIQKGKFPKNAKPLKFCNNSVLRKTNFLATLGIK